MVQVCHTRHTASTQHPPDHGTDTAHDAAGGCAALARSGSAHDVQPAGLFGLSGLNDLNDTGLLGLSNLNDIDTARPSRFGHLKTNYYGSIPIYLKRMCRGTNQAIKSVSIKVALNEWRKTIQG